MKELVRSPTLQWEGEGGSKGFKLLAFITSMLSTIQKKSPYFLFRLLLVFLF